MVCLGVAKHSSDRRSPERRGLKPAPRKIGHRGCDRRSPERRGLKHVMHSLDGKVVISPLTRAARIETSGERSSFGSQPIAAHPSGAD